MIPQNIVAFRDIKTHVCNEYVDMRNSIEGLSNMVKPLFNGEPTNGHAFIFLGKSRIRVKILIYNNGGYWLLYKRLDKGRFPEPEQLAERGLTFREMMNLLDNNINIIRAPKTAIRHLKISNLSEN